MRATWRLPLLLFIGSLLMQTAWILALPPFRGIDEFDHAYRAAAVARGEWVAQPASAASGRGQLVTVPRSIVDAATPECETYDYTGPADCRPVLDLGDGLVTVDSSAAAYNPVFYWLVGSPSRIFSGDSALYVMRIMTALLCSAFLALAGWATSLWARSRWPLVGLLVAMSPVAIYSTSIVAPNGLEMVAAIVTWMSLLGLVRRDLDAATQRALILAALPGALTLVTLRSLGPLWLALLLVTVIAAAGARWTVTLVRRHSSLLLVASTLVVAATLASLEWIHVAGTLNPLPNPTPYPNPVGNTLSQLPWWFFQSIAAFPTRTEQAPAVVYMGCILVGLALLVVGYRVAGRQLRMTIALSLALTIGVPVLLGIATYSQRGEIWQGRYGLPFGFGVMLVLGLALDATRPRHRLIRPVLLAGWLLLTVANIVSVANVLIEERSNSPLSGTVHWITPSTWMVVLPMLLGWVCWAAAAKPARQPERLVERLDAGAPTEGTQSGFSQVATPVGAAVQQTG